MTRNFAIVYFFILFVSILTPPGSAVFFPYVYPRLKLEAKAPEVAGEPLILTPYIQAGSISLAQNLSRVLLTEKMGFASYAGFLTIDKQLNSNLYFWFFPSFSKSPDAPVVLWLQGGPGGSSLFGLFTELGPLIAKRDGFALRKYHWAIKYNLLFIDNPVGTGFSFTDNDDGYCADEKCIATGLLNSLEQFFSLFPYLRNNEFYLTGESYAGKYIPSLAKEIHEQNAKNDAIKINLKGLAMGNAYCDPVNQLNYGSYLYQHGLIDNNALDAFQKLQGKIVEAIKKRNWPIADVLLDKLLDGEIGNFSYFKNYTGFNNYYNFLQPTDEEDMSLFIDLIHNEKVRNSVHVGGLPFNSGDKVLMHLANDILKSVAPIISELLSNYRIMFYNGQLDIIVAYPLTENFLRNLNFSSAEEYKTATRQIWRVNDDIAGYYKTAGNLTEVLVRNAGHMVPRDQSRWAFNLITKFISDKF